MSNSSETEIRTIPSQPEIDWFAAHSPDWMYPNKAPSAVYQKGVLSRGECNRILEEMRLIEAYPFPGCAAVTTEYPRSLGGRCLRKAIEFSHRQNDFYWQFKIDEWAAWMQEYKSGDRYQRHMDSGPGFSRKLTTVILLTPPGEYMGGDLVVYTPRPQMIPCDQGTIVTFPSWTHHEVLEVLQGHRETINLGFYGPPFK